MRVSALWFIYILAVLVVYALLTLAKGSLHTEIATRIFFSLFVGAIFVFIFLPSVTLASPDEQVWYSLILLLAFLFPLFLAAWIVWQRKNGASFLQRGTGESDCTVLEKMVACTEDGCRLVGEKKKCGGEVLNVRYGR